MTHESTIKSTQEQAVASWIAYLNQVRFDTFIAFENKQNLNLQNALVELDNALQEILHEITINRGGQKGIHGFIAEIAEVGIGNARQKIIGQPTIYKWENDNGCVDIIRDGIDIQMKFYVKNLSLDAIKTHFEKYPDFLNNGAKYLIPRDQYDRMKYLLSLTEEQANKLPTSDGTFSLAQWKYVHTFFETSNIDFEYVEPAVLWYKDVQKGTIYSTLENEKTDLKATDNLLRNDAKLKSKPSVGEGGKASAISAAIEGSTAFLICIAKKRKERKTIRNFTQDDWIEIAGETGIGTLKGGVRGISIYALTNYSKTPAAVSSALATAAFGVAEQVHLHRSGKITELQFIENSETLCLDASISALSSFIGQTVIPIPVLGAVIGNTVGATLYKIGKDTLSEHEQQIIQDYIDSATQLENDLSQDYCNYISLIEKNYSEYLGIVDQLYSVNIYTSFEGSISLAKYFGIPTEDILDSKEKIQAYFVD